jgi:hypothetical protein
MSIAASPESRAARLGREGVAQLAHLLEHDFGRATHPGEGVSVNQFLLDALDRGEHRAMTVYPADAPLGVCYVGSGGLVVPAGHASTAAGRGAAVVGLAGPGRRPRGGGGHRGAGVGRAVP